MFADAEHFVPAVYPVVHQQFHLAFPGEEHTTESVQNYFRGWLHGIRFAIEYRKWARVVEHLCFHTNDAEKYNPLHPFDNTAAWMRTNFTDVEPMTTDLLLKLVDRYETAGEEVVPSVDVDGNVVWVAGQPDPPTWFNERWGDE